MRSTLSLITLSLGAERSDGMAQNVAAGQPEPLWAYHRQNGLIE